MYRVTFNGTIVTVLKDGACVSWEEVERLLNSALSPARVAEGEVQSERRWEWPVSTVGRLINNLATLPPEMPFYTAYFVEIDGVRVARTTHPSLSRETVGFGRIQEYSPKSQSLVMWATAAPESPAKEQPSLRDAWNRLQELVQNEYVGCTNLAVAMNDVAGAIAAEIVCRAAKEQPGEPTLTGELVVGNGHFHVGVKLSTVQACIDRHIARTSEAERKRLFDDFERAIKGPENALPPPPERP